MVSDYKWKVVLVGDFAVGKTSLVRRFVYDEFSDSYLTTIGVKVTKKVVEINTTTCADLLLWDIAGIDKFTKISPEYIKGASAGIIVADLTRKSTIENIVVHAEILQRINPGMHIFAALNKSDLVENGDNFIRLLKDNLKESVVKFITLTSAKDGYNVPVLFKKLCDSILEGNIK